MCARAETLYKAKRAGKKKPVAVPCAVPEYGTPCRMACGAVVSCVRGGCHTRHLTNVGRRRPPSGPGGR